MLNSVIISPRLNKFGYYVFSVDVVSATAAATSRQGLCSRNCDTNAHIKFIFDTAIDDPEWMNLIDIGENLKN